MNCGLRPWLLTFRGPAVPYLATLRTLYFPGTEVVRVVDGTDETVTLHEELGDLRLNKLGCRELRVANLIWSFVGPMPYVEDEDLDQPAIKCDFRYQLGHGFQLDSPKGEGDRIYFELKLITNEGRSFEYTRHETRPYGVYMEDLSYSEIDCWRMTGVSLWSWLRFKLRTLISVKRGVAQSDGYLPDQLMGLINKASAKIYIVQMNGQPISLDDDFEADPHKSFHDDEAYSHLSERMQGIAQDWLNLSDKKTRLDYQLFIQQEEEEAQIRQEMKPVFSVSFGPNMRGTQMVEKNRFLDEDFLYCKERGGCWKCTPGKGK